MLIVASIPAINCRRRLPSLIIRGMPAAMLSPAAAAVDGRRAPPSPHATGSAHASAALTPATGRPARHAPHGPAADAARTARSARQRDSPIAATRQQPSKPIIDPASGYVLNIGASVAACPPSRARPQRPLVLLPAARRRRPRQKEGRRRRAAVARRAEDPVVYEGEPDGPLKGRTGATRYRK